MNFLDIIQGTPFWVWFLLAYLLLVGFQATKASIVPLWRTGIMPILFALWSLSSIYHKCSDCYYLYGLWFIVLVIGVIIGKYIMRHQVVTIDTDNLIHLRGSIIPLVLSLTLFALMYGLGAIHALNPGLKSNLGIAGIEIVLSGLIAGIFLGRFASIAYTFMHKNI